MTAWRIAVAALLVVVIALPLALPLVDLVSRGHVGAMGDHADHFFSLALNTLFLCGGTALVALPTGVFAAVLLFRTDLPGRRALRFLVVVALFVPLPLIVAAWQNAFGVGGWLVRQDVGSGPWAQGMLPAVLLSALAALPAVILLIGQGLLWVERELE